MASFFYALMLLSTSSSRAESFQAWRARAERAESRHDDRTALECYSNALSSWKPGDGKLSRAKASCARAALRERGADDAGALRDYTDCLAVDVKNPRGFDRRGRLLLKAGKTQAAIGDFYKAVALDMGFAQAYADRARAYELQGDLAFAREDYRRACKLGIKPACQMRPALASDETTRPPAKGRVKRVQISPAPTRPVAPKASRRPFSECLASLEACTDDGEAFGACVDKAAACERASARGCCPAACLAAFHRSINRRGLSEAAAYRSVFKPGSECAGSRGPDQGKIDAPGSPLLLDRR